MRALVVAGTAAVIALCLAAFFLLSEPDSASEFSTIVTETKSTIHLRADLAVSVEVADEDDERVTGLSGRDPLPDNHGLLFVFDEDGYPAIWMKDMRFAIDIIWIDREGVIVDIAQAVQPDSYPRTFSPQDEARYVLEMTAGYADARNVRVGDRTDIHEKFPPR